MSYTPYLIANFATGINDRLQPWLIPDDANESLFDGFVYRGVMSKREGYNYFATGERGGSTYRESRIVHAVVAQAAVEVPDGIIVTFTFTGTTQIARGSVTVNGSNPPVVGTDNGLGVITGVGITGDVDYITGVIHVTFAVPPVAASTVTVTYSFMPGNPVMMVATFITENNTKELIVADTQYVNRYNSVLNILQELIPTTTPYIGSKFDFFTWVNYASATSTPRLLFSNNVNVIQQYDGTSVTNYVYTMDDLATIPTAITTLTCSWMNELKDRLILLRTTENGKVFPQRIRISGTGINSDNFLTSATGAGVIDIPDGTWIQGAAFNRDDLIIFTEASTWVLKYTGNDTTPFTLNKIDESRGSDATFSAITYLNRTSAASKRGLIMTDGYRVERQDEEIPDFSFKEIDGRFNGLFTNFNLCFAGTVDADRDHYLIYPPFGSDTSKHILVTNYDEDNYSFYRLPLSCMGTFLTSVNITWGDLLIYPTWNAFAVAYGNWNSFNYNTGDPFSVGGGQNGEIWRLNVTEMEDNPVRIYNITVIDSVTIEVTTDFNNYRINGSSTADGDPDLQADYIYLTGILGMQEVNDQQFRVKSIVNRNVFQLDVLDTGFSALTFKPYISGGSAQRVIPFEALMKKFNPYVNQDKKVRCGWLYMYVDATESDLVRNMIIIGITNSNPCVITTAVNHNLSTGDQVGFFGIGGTTELNDTYAYITVLSLNTFSLNGIDSTGFGVFTTGGYVSANIPAKMDIEIITNDNVFNTQLNNLNPIPYQGSMTNMTFDSGSKKWYKVFINQVGKFIQFRLKNNQSGAKVNIQAMMPGFLPLGRLI